MRTKLLVRCLLIFLTLMNLSPVAHASADDWFPPIDGFEHSPIGNYSWDPPSGLLGSLNPLYIIAITLFLLVVFLYRFALMFFDFGKDPSVLYGLLETAMNMVTERLWDIILYFLVFFVIIGVIFAIKDYRKGNLANIGRRIVNFGLAFVLASVVVSLSGATIIKANQATQLLGEQISNKIIGGDDSEQMSLYTSAWNAVIESPFARGEVGNPELTITAAEAADLSAKTKTTISAGTKWSTAILSFPQESEERADMVASFEEWHKTEYKSAFSSGNRFLISLFIFLVGIVGTLFFLIFGVIFLGLFLAFVLVVLSAMVMIPAAFTPMDTSFLLMKWGKMFGFVLLATVSVQVYVTFFIILIDLTSSIKDIHFALSLTIITVIFLIGIALFFFLCSKLFGGRARRSVESFRNWRNKRNDEEDEKYDDDSTRSRNSSRGAHGDRINNSYTPSRTNVNDRITPDANHDNGGYDGTEGGSTPSGSDRTSLTSQDNDSNGKRHTTSPQRLSRSNKNENRNTAKKDINGSKSQTDLDSSQNTDKAATLQNSYKGDPQAEAVAKHGEKGDSPAGASAKQEKKGTSIRKGKDGEIKDPPAIIGSDQVSKESHYKRQKGYGSAGDKITADEIKSKPKQQSNSGAGDRIEPEGNKNNAKSGVGQAAADPQDNQNSNHPERAAGGENNRKAGQEAKLGEVTSTSKPIKGEQERNIQKKQTIERTVDNRDKSKSEPVSPRGNTDKTVDYNRRPTPVIVSQEPAAKPEQVKPKVTKSLQNEDRVSTKSSGAIDPKPEIKIEQQPMSPGSSSQNDRVQRTENRLTRKSKESGRTKPKSEPKITNSPKNKDSLGDDKR